MDQCSTSKRGQYLRTNSTPLQTAGRHKRLAFFMQRADLFRSDPSSYPAQPAVSHHQSGQDRPRLPWHSQCLLVGIGRGAERDVTPDALRFPAGLQVPYRLALAAEFDPCSKYASVLARFKGADATAPQVMGLASASAVPNAFSMAPRQGLGSANIMPTCACISGPRSFGARPDDVRSSVPAQPVDATQALNLSAGVSNCKVSRGFRWLCSQSS
jgi:hypothetical protein